MMCPRDGRKMDLWVFDGTQRPGWVCPYCKEHIPIGFENVIEPYPVNNED
jgi:hypothetical protein